MATGGSGSDTEYKGWLFYEEKGLNEYVAIFTVAKDRGTLDDYKRRKHPKAAKGVSAIRFRFVQQDSTLRDEYMELKFDTPQDEPTTGWIIKPHTVPCRIFRRDVDKFGTPGYPDPPSCSISVHAIPDAVLRLRYTIPVEGVDMGIHILLISKTLIRALLCSHYAYAFGAYYAQNYAGIIRQGLMAVARAVVTIQRKCQILIASNCWKKLEFFRLLLSVHKHLVGPICSIQTLVKRLKFTGLNYSS
uniref:Uncharacterized protein n=1 Tax=Amphimedon queenslandica TaxID=400682 RepID=A0A1X7TIF0_AMPQE